MNQKYVEGLSKEQRACWGFQVFIRLWLSGMCRSGAVADWTISELAIIFEVTQAALFADRPHTQNSLVEELGLTKQMVSRHVINLEEKGVLRQERSPFDGRAKFLYPADHFFARDAMARIAKQFTNDWYHGWEKLDKAHGAEWYVPMSNCDNSTVRREIEKFKELAIAS